MRRSVLARCGASAGSSAMKYSSLWEGTDGETDRTKEVQSHTHTRTNFCRKEETEQLTLTAGHAQGAVAGGAGQGRAES